ncbi:MAG TPA: phasin family protein [Myxococcales bacterium]|jgi:polyhydroxyalkanoate synthesis regulator phasin
MVGDDEKPVEEHKSGDWFREAWSQALVAVNAAEEEAGRLLLKAGELAGWKPDDVRRYATEFGERLASQRKELEKSLDERVNKALARVKVPKREEISALAKRVGRVAERIEALEARRK